VTLFPPICPTCHSSSGRAVIPDSPEVETYQCQNCRRSWSQPALDVRLSVPTTRRRWWHGLWRRKKLNSGD
jgi:hypothetical protein